MTEDRLQKALDAAFIVCGPCGNRIRFTTTMRTVCGNPACGCDYEIVSYAQTHGIYIYLYNGATGQQQAYLGKLHLFD